MPRRQASQNSAANGSAGRAIIEQQKPRGGAVAYSEPSQRRPQGFESDFVEPPKSRDKHTIRDANPFRSPTEEMSPIHRGASLPNAESTPVNELSLAAELSGFDIGVTTGASPVNNHSLAK